MYLKCLQLLELISLELLSFVLLCRFFFLSLTLSHKHRISVHTLFCFSGACGCRSVIMCVSECVWCSDLSWWRDVWRWKHLLSNSGRRIRLLPATQRKSLLNCIYLIKNTVKTVTLWNSFTIQNIYFLLECVLKCNLILWCKAEFSASLLQSSVSRVAAGP